MLSNNAFARIHDRINNRMLHRLRKPFKKIREQYADERTIPDVSDDLQEAIYSALVTGFVFGKGSVVVEILKKEKKFLDVADAQIIQFALTQDKDIWYAIAGKTLFRKIMSEPDAMAAYFSPSEGALSFLKSYSFDIAQVQMQNISEEAQALFKDTMLEGMSNEQAAKYLNSKIKNLTNLRARAIARTESTRAFNLGTLYESQSSAIVKGYRYNAVLDNLTTDICKARDGKFIPKTELTMIASNTPPLHVNCRSRLETVLDDEKEGEWMATGGLPEAKQRPSDIQAVNQFLKMQKTTPIYIPPVTVEPKKPEEPVGKADFTKEELEKSWKLKYLNNVDKEIVYEAYKEMDAASRKILNEYWDDLRFIVHDPKINIQTCYDPTQNVVFITEKTLDKHILKHELGHFVDNHAIIRQKSLDIKSIEFLSGTSSPIGNKTREFAVKYKGKKELINDVCKDLKVKRIGDKNTRPLSDIINATTRETLGTEVSETFTKVVDGKTKTYGRPYYTKYIHEEEYWQEAGKVESEVFAELWTIKNEKSATVRNRSVKVLNKYFPGLWDTFESTLKGLL